MRGLTHPLRDLSPAGTTSIKRAREKGFGREGEHPRCHHQIVKVHITEALKQVQEACPNHNCMKTQETANNECSGMP